MYGTGTDTRPVIGGGYECRMLGVQWFRDTGTKERIDPFGGRSTVMESYRATVAALRLQFGRPTQSSLRALMPSAFAWAK